MRPSNKAAAIASDTVSASRAGVTGLVEKRRFLADPALMEIPIFLIDNMPAANIATRFFSCQAVTSCVRFIVA